MKSATMPTASEVGIRELRDNLSRYLAQVEAGTQFVITDHKRRVALLMPAAQRVDPVEALIRAGKAQAPRRPKQRLSATRLPAISNLVAAQRR